MAPHLEVLHLPVRTQSGRALGVISDVIIEPDTQSVVSYEVRRNRLVPAAMTKTLLVSRSQVIGFDAEGMIVDDNLAGDRVTSPAAQPAA